MLPRNAELFQDQNRKTFIIYTLLIYVWRGPQYDRQTEGNFNLFVISNTYMLIANY